MRRLLLRLECLFDSFKHFKQHVKALSVEDEAIQKTIKKVYEDEGYICCPHTATAFYVRQQLNEQPWILAATADPCKFDKVIEPIIHHLVRSTTATTTVSQAKDNSTGRGKS